MNNDDVASGPENDIGNHSTESGKESFQAEKAFQGIAEPLRVGPCTVGHVAECNGGTAILLRQRMTIHEAFVLLRHWIDEHNSVTRFCADHGQSGSSEVRTITVAINRISALETAVAENVRHMIKTSPMTGDVLRDLRDIQDELDHYIEYCKGYGGSEDHSGPSSMEDLATDLKSVIDAKLGPNRSYINPFDDKIFDML